MAILLHPSDPTTSGISQPGGRNYDYTKIYSPNKPGDEAKENARVWNVYLDEAENYDMDMIQGFRNIIDGLLVFAALFSAVVTTFVAQTSQALQPDNSQIMVYLLIENNQLLRAAGNTTSINAVPTASLGPESQTYTSVDVWVNGLFFTSLALSLSTALLSVLAKQWIQAYTAIVSGSAKTRAVTRHFRFKGLVKWKLGDIIESLPLILHCAVAVFLIGLTLYISQLSRPICGVVAGITALTFLFYFGSSIIPAFDIACPYRIPFLFSLAQLLLCVSGWIQWAYLTLCNKPRILSWSQIQRQSLKAAEQKEVLNHDHNLTHNPLRWVFNHSSNYSVREIVIEGTCGLLNEAFYDPCVDLESLLSSPEDNIFFSAVMYALSRLSDLSSTSFREDEIGKNTGSGQLIAAFMKFPFIKARADGSTTHLSGWQGKIMEVLLEAYTEVLRKQHDTLSRYILELGGLRLQSDSDWSKLFLFVCLDLGDAKDLRDLVDLGIDLNCHDPTGWTALHHAAYRGSLDSVIILIEQEPALVLAVTKWLDPNSAWTALDLATYKGNSDIVGYLVGQGAKSISHDILYAAMANPSSPVELGKVEFFLDHGWDRTVQDTEGKTLLDVAHSEGDTALVDHLKNYQTVRLSPYVKPFHTLDENVS
ncbi:hypothetical protein C0992_002108 [Termitomyces sp. T32_za158]|nr:hypothetical protein C0992_002108 [Termitomyces sp. T32_za158]